MVDYVAVLFDSPGVSASQGSVGHLFKKVVVHYGADVLSNEMKGSFVRRAQMTFSSEPVALKRGLLMF